MSKKSIYIILGILIGLLVVGGGIYAYSSNQTKDDDQKENTTSETKTAESRKASFVAVAGEGESQYCTMKYSGPKGSGEGKMYTDGEGSGRMEMTLQTEKGNSGTSNQIIKGDKVYSWFETDGKTIGMIMPLKETSANTESTTQESQDSNPSPNEDFTLNCEDWDVDPEKFEVPTAVKFIDMQNLPSASQ